MTSKKQELIAFLKKYKDLPCLWDPSDTNYSNKDARSKALEILVDKYKLIDSHADVKIVKDKIEHMRYSYNRELRKIHQSRRNPSSSEEKLVTPTLWYYPYLTFLNKISPLSRMIAADTAGQADISMNASSSDTNEGSGLSDDVLKQRQLLINFIKTYESLPVLWDKTNKFYNNKKARDESYDLLLKTYKPICDNATVRSMKMKIDNLRHSYVNERKKILARDNSYVPTLWYYPYMVFLNSQTANRGRRTSEDCDQEASIGANYSNEAIEDETFVATEFLDDDIFHEELSFESLDAEDAKIKLESEEITIDNYENIDENQENLIESNYFINLPNDVTEANSGDDDVSASRDKKLKIDLHREAVMFGKTIGLNLKGLSRLQQVVAEKLISDIIFLGKTEQLNVNSFVELNEQDP